MSNKGADKGIARQLEHIYNTKARGISYNTMLRLVREHGVGGAIAQLEALGMAAIVEALKCTY